MGTLSNLKQLYASQFASNAVSKLTKGRSELRNEPAGTKRTSRTFFLLQIIWLKWKKNSIWKLKKRKEMWSSAFKMALKLKGPEFNMSRGSSVWKSNK